MLATFVRFCADGICGALTTTSWPNVRRSLASGWPLPSRARLTHPDLPAHDSRYAPENLRTVHESLGQKGLLLEQQIFQLALHHRRDQPSLEARAARALPRRLLDGGRECDESMCIVAGLLSQDARKIVSLIRQLEIEEDDAWVVGMREDECARCAAHGAYARVSPPCQQAREPSPHQTVGDHDQDAGALFGRKAAS